MKILMLFYISIGLPLPYYAIAQPWKNECAGYYQLQLPDNLEIALYPIEEFVNPDKEPVIIHGILISRYSKSGITFGINNSIQDKDSVQAQFSEYYYANYKLGITSESNKSLNFQAYKERIIDNINFGYNVDKQLEEKKSKITGIPLTPSEEFTRKHNYLIKNYMNSFATFFYRGHTIYINSGKRLYQFWSKHEKDTGEKSQTVEAQIKKSEPEVLSLINRFRSRELYEVPAKQGFCIPYGFIADDSGHESRNMGVTYRLKNHPDVTIFFQDLGPNPGPGERSPDPNMSAKDYLTYFWNVRYGHSFREIKLYGEEFTYPEIDNRKAVAAFAKFTRFSKEIDYGYVAFVKGTTPDEPDLLFYVMRDSRQAKGNPPMDKDELEKMAEHIVSSIKRR